MGGQDVAMEVMAAQVSLGDKCRGNESKGDCGQREIPIH